jgi:predicted PurR-regulated permease PerM
MLLNLEIEVNNGMKYNLFKGYVVLPGTSFEQKRTMVKKLRRYSRYKKAFTNPIKNTLRLSVEKVDPDKILNGWIDAFFDFIERWFGLIAVYAFAVPLLLVHFTIVTILAVFMLPKGYCDSLLIKRFSKEWSKG